MSIKEITSVSSLAAAAFGLLVTTALTPLKAAEFPQRLDYDGEGGQDGLSSSSLAAPNGGRSPQTPVSRMNAIKLSIAAA